MGKHLSSLQTMLGLGVVKLSHL